jgi:hypothetical protein
MLLAKRVEAFEQEPGRKYDVDREADLRLPAACEIGGGTLEAARFLDQRAPRR